MASKPPDPPPTEEPPRRPGGITMASNIDIARMPIPGNAELRLDRPVVLSLYLNLDPSIAPTAADVATRVRSLLDNGSKSHGAPRGDLAHEVRLGLRNDFERLQRFFDPVLA